MKNLTIVTLLGVSSFTATSCKQIKAEIESFSKEEEEEDENLPAPDSLVASTDLPVVKAFPTLTPATFSAFTAPGDRISIVQFYSHTSAASHSLSSVFKKLAAKGQPGVQYAKVELKNSAEMGQVYGVSTTPDTRIFHNGKQIDQFVGNADAANVENLIAKHLWTAKVVTGQGEAQPIIQRRKSLPSGIQRIPSS